MDTIDIRSHRGKNVTNKMLLNFIQSCSKLKRVSMTLEEFACERIPFLDKFKKKMKISNALQSGYCSVIS